MRRVDPRAILLAAVVLVAGCGGVAAPEQGEQRLRLVVQNEAASERTVDLTLTDAEGGTVLDESKALAPGGGWVVSTFDVPSLATPVTIRARMPGQNYSNELTPIRGADRGSRLLTITDDGIQLHECNTNVTCWKRTA